MKEFILNIDGMKCGMCEAHVNDVVRKAYKVKSVKSSHIKNKTVIVSDDETPINEIADKISADGYKVLSIEEKAHVKKGLFSR